MIRFENINLAYNGKHILKDFSLHVRPGEKVLIRGKSGSGKSTLLKMITGLVRPDSGELLFRGEPVARKNLFHIRSNIAYVPQDPGIGRGTVKEIIDEIFSYRTNQSVTPSEEDINRCMRLFDLPGETPGKDFSLLSGGEKQRVSLTIALLMKRDVFLLDEITAGLDSELKRKTARHFIDNPQWTCLIVSHDNEWARHSSLRTVQLEAL